MRRINLPIGMRCHKLIPRLPRTDRDIKDLTGFINEDNTVLGYVGIVDKSVMWLCKCKCGKKRVMSTAQVKKVRMCRKCNVKKLNWSW